MGWQWLTAGTRALAAAVLEAAPWLKSSWRLPLTLPCCSGLCLVGQLCLTLVTPWTVACQAPLSMVFSRQEHSSGLPCPPPGDLSNPGIEPGSPALQVDSLPAELSGKPSLVYSEVTQSCSTLCNPVDCSPPGSSFHGIFQSRVLE